jgi:nitroimidazol reductase NimA-like FMN-containing flavoprotein (pyridoxamine 5'-phosphate oxidase superfamily)
MKIQSTTSDETLSIVNDFLQTHRSGTLATADAAANPHGAVIYFTYNGDYSFSFVTKTETQKYKNIEENKSVALVIYDEEEQASVQVTGYVKVIDDKDESYQVISKSFKYSAEVSHRELPPLEKLFAGEYVALRLIPQVIKMAVFARPESGDDELYETILLSED